jgi:PIN domain nuclease of toxin-antitoxin system
MAAVLDTHALIWYLLRAKQLSLVALQSIRNFVGRGQPIYVSAISIVEAIYLVERGRVPLAALERIEEALKDPSSGLLEPVSKMPERTKATNREIPSGAKAPDFSGDFRHG